MENSYEDFILSKSQSPSEGGFEVKFLPEGLFDFQASLVHWSLRFGRAALLVDCGLGKTPMQLAWAQNIVQRENAKVLVFTPLAVGAQTIREGEKFGIKCVRSRDGVNLPGSGIIVSNYEKIGYFNPSDFVGVVCDESSILKSFDGVRRQQITDFMRKMKYRLLCTATAAPNDYLELGTSSEALGNLGYMDMLHRFFVADDGRGSAAKRGWGKSVKFRLKGHAEMPFWRWVTGWARAARRPSDLGFDDGPFVLPPLNEEIHLVRASTPPRGRLIDVMEYDLREQREVARRTISDRCERVAQLCADNQPALIWCNLNDEGTILSKMVQEAVEVSGSESDEAKEEKFLDFTSGRIRKLITKPKIGAWGLNFQHCAHVVIFPTYSWEQYYQGIRRCWRFGQHNPVTVDVVGTEGLRPIMESLVRKADQVDQMFDSLVACMNDSLFLSYIESSNAGIEVPSWM